MRLYVETQQGFLHKIDCKPNETIVSLKAKIHQDCGPDPDEQTLILETPNSMMAKHCRTTTSKPKIHF